jgi:L-histidine N-alpha-methyltransferase
VSRDDNSRLRVELCAPANQSSTLASDVRAGLARSPKSLPPKHFYDERGARLFDAICDTPEYYPTRAEQALLERIAAEVIAEVAPTDVVELGSGSARKTRVLLDAVGSVLGSCRYVPFDVSEEMLRVSSRRLLSDYPWLTVHGIVGDYDLHLDRLPAGDRRLFLFLGGTIGNFDLGADTRFLSRIAGRMGADDRLLLGTDLVKDRATLNAAYNDAQGITAEFNRNVLAVINRELGGHFDLPSFEHVAFYDPEKERIEMHLRARRTHDVAIDALAMNVHFERGETILTEISRKFTRASVGRMLEKANLEERRWFAAEDDAFALTLARPKA